MRPLDEVLSFFQRNIAIVSHFFAAIFTPMTVRSALRRGLHAIYVKGDVTQVEGSSLITPTHHSWWDGYLLWLLGKKLSQPLYIMMDEAQLDSLSFLRAQGVFGKKEVRFALRQLQAGATVGLFPEGELRNAANVQDIHNGLAFFSRKTGAKLYPLVIRVVMRGAEKPEVFMALGDAVVLGDWLEAMHRLQAEVNTDILQTHPEQVPRGYAVWQAAPLRFEQKVQILAKRFRVFE